ncbi:MAG: AAA family ATPase [Acidobacteria bacterium]|nr:AAA family ATPase [Acidobacteriota bacterium]
MFPERPSDVSPHDLDAERAVLGALLVAPSRLSEITSLGLQPVHFFRVAHRLIFRHILTLSAQGETIDPIILKRSLGDDLEEVGGFAYLSMLTDGIPKLANVAAYAKVVMHHWTARTDEAAYVKAIDEVRTLGPGEARERLLVRLSETGSPPRLTARTGLDLVLSHDVLTLDPSWPMLVPGSISAIVGQPAAGKTLLVIRMTAELLKAGRRVVVCALDGNGGLRGRLRAACSAFDLTHKHLENLVVVESLLLGDDKSVRDVITVATRADVVIIDTLARALGGLDENSASAVGTALNGCARISKGVGNAAVVIVHHMNKSGGSERGSTALRAGVDTLAFLEDQGEERVLKTDKMRDAECPPPRVFRLRLIPEHSSVVLDDAVNVSAAGSETELSTKTRQVLAELRMVGSASGKEISDNLHGRVARSTVFGALKSMEALGLVKQKGSTWSAARLP